MLVSNSRLSDDIECGNSAEMKKQKKPLILVASCHRSETDGAMSSGQLDRAETDGDMSSGQLDRAETDSAIVSGQL